MNQSHFSFYGIQTTITSNNEQLLNLVKKDFSSFCGQKESETHFRVQAILRAEKPQKK